MLCQNCRLDSEPFPCRSRMMAVAALREGRRLASTLTEYLLRASLREKLWGQREEQGEV